MGDGRWAMGVTIGCFILCSVTQWTTTGAATWCPNTKTSAVWIYFALRNKFHSGWNDWETENSSVHKCEHGRARKMLLVLWGGTVKKGKDHRFFTTGDISHMIIHTASGLKIIIVPWSWSLVHPSWKTLVKDQSIACRVSWSSLVKNV